MCVLALVYNEDFAESSSVSAALMVIFLAAMIQGLGASDCKCRLVRDRRKSKTANRSTAICGGPFDQYLNWLVCGVYKSSVLQSDVPRPCTSGKEYSTEVA
jgi:hypothetical protein